MKSSVRTAIPEAGVADSGEWDLPGFWCWVRFDDVATIDSNLVDPAEYRLFPHIAPNHIESGTGRLLAYTTISGDGVTSSKHLFRAGHILYSKIRPYLAKVVRVDFEGLCSADMYPISTEIDYGFLHRWLVSPMFTGIVAQSQDRTVLPKINQEALSRQPVPLAPLPEQRRIVAKLDALQSRTRIAREALDAVAPLLKSFRQSVLQAAVSGALTEEWRSKQGESEPWKDVALNEVAMDFSYGTAAKSSKTGEIPVLRMGNIQDGKLDWNGLVFTSDKAEIKRFSLASGDVLFNRTNSPELVGKTAVYRGERPAVYAGYLVKVRCGALLLPDYLNFSLSSPSGRDWCWEVKTDGVSQSNISAGKLAQYRLELPPLAEQTEIVRRVRHLFAMADAMEAEFAAAQRLVDQLDQSLLATAFRGELVPQDPSDEPASVLLERIRAARTALPEAKGKRGRKPELAPSGARLASEDFSPSPTAPKKRGRPRKA